MATRRPVESPGKSGNPQAAPAVFFIEFRQRHTTPQQEFCRRQFCSLPRKWIYDFVLNDFVFVPSLPLFRGPELDPHRATVRPITGHPKTGKLPNEPKSPSTPCHGKALPSNNMVPEVVAFSPTTNPNCFSIPAPPVSVHVAKSDLIKPLFLRNPNRYIKGRGVRRAIIGASRTWRMPSPMPTSSPLPVRVFRVFRG